jgi:hypothetical protein
MNRVKRLVRVLDAIPKPITPQKNFLKYFELVEIDKNPKSIAEFSH